MSQFIRQLKLTGFLRLSNEVIIKLPCNYYHLQLYNQKVSFVLPCSKGYGLFETHQDFSNTKMITSWVRSRCKL